MYRVLIATALAVVQSPVPSPPPLPAGTCPVGPERPCRILLSGPEAPRRSAACTDTSWATYLTFDTTAEAGIDRNRDGAFESVLTINLDPRRGCRCLSITVTFADELDGFPLNLGDSPTNDGHGGDAGTTAYSAELTVAKFNDGRSRLDVFSATPRGERFVENLLTLELGKLARQRLEFQVCDQDLTAVMPDRGASEPLVVKLRSPNSGRLFALGGQDRTAVLGETSTGDYRLFVGVNRVIHDRHAGPSFDRFGRGVKEIELYLSP